MSEATLKSAYSGTAAGWGNEQAQGVLLKQQNSFSSQHCVGGMAEAITTGTVFF